MYVYIRARYKRMKGDNMRVRARGEFSRFVAARQSDRAGRKLIRSFLLAN